MKIKNGAEYMESLKKVHPVIYYKGEKIDDVTTHPATAPHVRAAAMTYSLASEDEYKDVATAVSHLTGNTISRFTHVHQNVEDLLKKIKLFERLMKTIDKYSKGLKRILSDIAWGRKAAGFD